MQCQLNLAHYPWQVEKAKTQIFISWQTDLQLKLPKEYFIGKKDKIEFYEKNTLSY